MGSVVAALTGGGGSGMGFQAQSADLLNPSTVKQADEQYGNVQQGLNGQQQFLQAVQAQNGLGNQSSVFNQQQAIANGQGPNPAQAMLNNATGANVANQAALMAGQRGSSANAGLMARQAAQAGAGIQQNAAGQGAALQAQQSLGALNQMGGIANQQAGQQANATNAYSQAAQGAQGQVLNSINNQNQAAIGNASQQNTANAAMANQTAQQQGNLLGNLTGGIGAGLETLTGGKGGLGGVLGGLIKPAAGMIGGMFGGPAGAAAGTALGNMVSPSATGGQSEFDPSKMMAAEGGMITGPRSKVGQHFHGLARPAMPMMAEGGKVPAMVSPGEGYLSPQKVDKVAKGADPIETSEKIPGKPKVGGAKNSYANDTIKKDLQEGGIVLPRSIMKAKHPHWEAHKFVSAILKEQALKGKK